MGDKRWGLVEDILRDNAFERDSGTLASFLLPVCSLGHEVKALVCVCPVVICCLTTSLKIRGHGIVNLTYPVFFFVS